MSETPRHHRSVRVPAAQAAAVLEALVTTYAAKAGALAATAGQSLAVMHDARRELAEAEDALEAIGWGPPAPGGDGLELAGPAGLVREVLYAALVAAAEAVGERCREYEAARVGREGLAAAVADVVVLWEVFAGFEVADAL